MLSADDYDAELAERYGWINRALPADALDEFVRTLAHRIAAFPAAGHVGGQGSGQRDLAWRRSRTSVATPISSVTAWAAPRRNA